MYMNVLDKEAKGIMVDSAVKRLDEYCDKVKQCNALQHQIVANFINKQPAYSLKPDKDGSTHHHYSDYGFSSRLFFRYKFNFVLEKFQQERKQRLHQTQRYLKK